jgi:dTDP-glucose 4,6-dehydratase
MPTTTRHIIVTGGAGFIGSQFVRTALAQNYSVTVFDSLTYAGSMSNLPTSENLHFVSGSITNFTDIEATLDSFINTKKSLCGFFNFAAESHVDNSISGPKIFIETNIVGTFNILEVLRSRLDSLKENSSGQFRMVHVSTDEVFGQLGQTGIFSETSPYAPSSPYSASKAASDHLVRAWGHTYGLPVIITNCSNNFGPRQYPEKLIPHTPSRLWPRKQR